LHFCNNVHCICGGLCARNACHALRFLGCVPLPWRQGPCAPPGQSPPLWVMWPPAGELGEERRVGYGGERGRGRRPGGTRDTWRAWLLGSCILVTMAIQLGPFPYEAVCVSAHVLFWDLSPEFYPGFFATVTRVRFKTLGVFVVHRLCAPVDCIHHE
jgi:hypothetical protein